MSCAVEDEIGDVDRDGSVRITDAVGILRGLFQGAALACPPAGDVNGDAEWNVSDAVYLLGYLFLGGADPVGEPMVRCDASRCAGCLRR